MERSLVDGWVFARGGLYRPLAYMVAAKRAAIMDRVLNQRRPSRAYECRQLRAWHALNALHDYVAGMAARCDRWTRYVASLEELPD